MSWLSRQLRQKMNYYLFNIKTVRFDQVHNDCFEIY